MSFVHMLSENVHCIFLPVLSLPLGKTTVMHMIVKEKLPDEQSTGQSVHRTLQALTRHWGTSVSIIPCRSRIFMKHNLICTTCVKECFGLCTVLGEASTCKACGRSLLSVFYVIKGWVRGLGVILRLLVLSRVYNRKSVQLPYGLCTRHLDRMT